MRLSRLIEGSPSAGRDDTVLDAVRIIADHKVGAIAILEDGRIIGIFTERDVLRRVILAGRDAASTTLGEVMTTPVHTVTKDVPIGEATSLLNRHGIRHLPLVEGDGKYIGMLVLRHLHDEIMARLERRVNDLTTWLMADSLGG
ncbi:MAG: cyclic nucleotide-binding/CBS domain-containing protein [Sandaracinaceae bacterium]